jgi:hypothetical protein
LSVETGRARRICERLVVRRAAHVRRRRIYRVGFAILGAAGTLAVLVLVIVPGRRVRRHPGRAGDARCLSSRGLGGCSSVR